MVVSNVQKYRRQAPVPPGEKKGGAERERKGEIFIFPAELIAVSGRRTLGNMVSLRLMRARQCAVWWSQVIY